MALFHSRRLAGRAPRQEKTAWPCSVTAPISFYGTYTMTDDAFEAEVCWSSSSPNANQSFGGPGQSATASSLTFADSVA